VNPSAARRRHSGGHGYNQSHFFPSTTKYVFILYYYYYHAVGVDTDADAAALLLKELEGKDVEEVIAEGREKLSSVPAGGAVAVAGGAAAAAGGDAPAAEEKVEEEEDEDMGFSLFD
jgi:large subunit ribosomal protein LP2